MDLFGFGGSDPGSALETFDFVGQAKLLENPDGAVSARLLEPIESHQSATSPDLKRRIHTNKQ